jgi:hypothetical protein
MSNNEGMPNISSACQQDFRIGITGGIPVEKIQK